MLDRAALEYCLADAFHPGCEVTWPMRHLTMYSKPFRIRHRPSGAPDPLYGSTLTQPEVLGRNGPLFAQGPGDLTRWMGLPWQADTAFCRSGYDPTYDPFQPTFWPARVPNFVLTDQDYAVVMDPSQPRPHRLEAFTNRTSWNDPLQGDTAGQMEDMVRIFGSMGLLEPRPGPVNDPDLPPVMLVATYGPDVPAVVRAGARDAATGCRRGADAPSAREAAIELPIGRRSAERATAGASPEVRASEPESAPMSAVTTCHVAPGARVVSKPLRGQFGSAPRKSAPPPPQRAKNARRGPRSGGPSAKKARWGGCKSPGAPIPNAVLRASRCAFQSNDLREVPLRIPAQGLAHDAEQGRHDVSSAPTQCRLQPSAWLSGCSVVALDV